MNGFGSRPIPVDEFVTVDFVRNQFGRWILHYTYNSCSMELIWFSIAIVEECDIRLILREKVWALEARDRLECWTREQTSVTTVCTGND